MLYLNDHNQIIHINERNKEIICDRCNKSYK
jgi:hypothetical protein